MRNISSEIIIKEVRRLCIESNLHLSSDIKSALISNKNKEEGLPREILDIIIKNSEVASSEKMPMCQDTGMAIIFVEIGQDVHIEGDYIEDAINEGVRRGYEDGYLRKSIVSDPIERINTRDNTPAVIHYEIVKGDKIKITVSPKGFGSENMSQIKMLKPSEGIDGVKDFILKVVKESGSNPCPPIIVGVGIGGSFEKAALLSKKALLRPIDKESNNPYYAALENEILEKINKLGIGPQGFGGYTTAIGVNIEVYPTHIAGLPVSVNISCHATRHMSVVI
ncbi:MAG: fumarate hydratase [Clostridium sp.]|uniref:fumarate hydratase n=1 Tax=Clostridium sp. TaxID=1506 RepID=UPI002FCAB9E7